MNTSGEITLGNVKGNLLAYTDDLALLGNIQAEVGQICKELILTVEKVRLCINDEKNRMHDYKSIGVRISTRIIYER